MKIKDVLVVLLVLFCFGVGYVYATYTAYVYFTGQYVSVCEEICQQQGYSYPDECFRHMFCDDNTAQIAAIGVLMNVAVPGIVFGCVLVRQGNKEKKEAK